MVAQSSSSLVQSCEERYTAGVARCSLRPEVGDCTARTVYKIGEAENTGASSEALQKTFILSIIRVLKLNLDLANSIWRLT